MMTMTSCVTTRGYLDLRLSHRTLDNSTRYKLPGPHSYRAGTYLLVLPSLTGARILLSNTRLGVSCMAKLARSNRFGMLNGALGFQFQHLLKFKSRPEPNITVVVC